jgi:ADP-ribosyl-[dinitrogen reductase] hydrolase
MRPTRDKVLGTFLGVAIGDALGKPVETLTAADIAAKHGRITAYRDCGGHPWFGGDRPGTTTDDWQLTAAVARAFIRARGAFDVEAIAAEHIWEFARSVRGWGSTTKEAVARLSSGVHYTQSGETDTADRGAGNGVCMKVAPVGCYMAVTNPDCDSPQWDEDVEKLARLALMTHYTGMAVTSGLAQSLAVLECLAATPESFDRESFIGRVCRAGEAARRCLPEAMSHDDITDRLKLLYKYEEFGVGRIIGELKGNYYVHESLPFTLMFFVKDPYSVETLYDCVSAGGDTDTNGSMLAALLGALHGSKIFPDHLVQGLEEKERVLALANEFCDALQVG